MKTVSVLSAVLSLAVAPGLAYSASGSQSGSAGSLKVFVFAGQSNMEGQAEVESYNKTDGKLLNGTLKYQVQDPRTATTFAPTWDAVRNNWTILDDVKVWYNECPGGTYVNGSTIPGTPGVDYTAGNLSVGYGCEGNPNLIGPEYGFGFGMHAGLAERRAAREQRSGRYPSSSGSGGLEMTAMRDPTNEEDTILIVKNAWGGKTLAGDFRPPRSASGWEKDPYCTDEATCSVAGHFYEVMMSNVAKIMQPGVIAEIFPETATLKPEIAGFGWFQGWNDGCDLNQTAAYEVNMVNLIQDLRDAWKVPELPVVIAAAGFDGFTGEEATRQPPDCWTTGNKINCNCAGDRGCRRLDIVLSQEAASNLTRHPELKGNVGYVETRGFWREAQYSPNQGQGYHYWHNAETYYLIGQGMAKSMLSFL